MLSTDYRIEQLEITSRYFNCSSLVDLLKNAGNPLIDSIAPDIKLLITYQYALWVTREIPTHLMINPKNQRVIGIVGFIPRNNGITAQLHPIWFIDRQHRERGLGSLLYQSAEKAIPSYFEILLASMRSDNKPSIEFAKKQGFKPFSVHANYCFLSKQLS